jgi:hypothetical protein
MRRPAPRCGRRFSPHAHFNQVPPRQVQQQLRQAFARWGRPGRLQVDNGSPWGSWSDLPPPLALWLAGLGLPPRYSPPGRPQVNGVVERSHGTAQRWADPARCGSARELQEQLDREDVVLREEYPYRLGQSRWQVYPELRHSGRRYSAAWERAHWSWGLVCDHLGEHVVQRRVDCSGKVGLYHDKLYVGTALRRREVLVQFDASQREWVLADARGAELCRRRLTQFDERSLRNLR